MWRNCLNAPFMPGGGGIWGFIFTALIIAAIVFLLVRFFSARRNESHPTNHARHDRDDSLEILKRKFANQEISEEEYLRMKKILLS